MNNNCNTYKPITNTSNRCIYCGKLEWEHKDKFDVFVKYSSFTYLCGLQIINK